MRKIFLFGITLILFGSPIKTVALDMAQGQVEIHGFVSQGYLVTDRNNFLGKTDGAGSFDYNEVGVNALTSVSDDLEVGMQLLNRNFVDVAASELRIDWAQATYHVDNEFGLKFGKVRLPYALYTQTRDIDLARASIFLPQSIYTEFARDTEAGMYGAGIFGSLPGDSIGSLDYDFFIGKVDLTDKGGEVKFFEDGGSPFDVTEFNAGTTLVARSFWNLPLEGMKIGGSIAGFPLNIGGHIEPIVSRESHHDLIPFAGTSFHQKTDVLTYIFSWEYVTGPLTLASEYQVFKFGSFDTTTFAGRSSGNARTSEGSYLMASYRLSDLLQLGSYYALYYRDKNDHSGRDFSAKSGLPDYASWQQDLALSLRFDITDYWIVKLEGHYLDGTVRTFIDANIDPVTGEGELARSWYMGAVKTTVAF
ncbi:MAG: hypothetical protein PHC51_11355 [bacterium]|nr:hypothetical protein [bacterium]